ncbi:MAG TPA: fumarylacetoacetase [Xanthobacteraceae bacterium]|jgi:fumarylacetoacetase|nr:fumarylacetoacetase [Xanthobacteraceae bacterium]
MIIDQTHDPALKSFIATANVPGCAFPIQNLPYCAFRRRSATGAPRIGVAIGDDLLDIAAVADLLNGAAGHAAAACAAPHLNDLMRLGPAYWAALRSELSQLLSATDAERRSRVETDLTPIAAAEFFVPVQIGNFTDFFASIFHATNTGRLFRPDNPLLLNYKYVPVAYHGRASSVQVSGAPVRRPLGQTKRAEDPAPVYRPARSLDYELELGFYIGRPSTLGVPVPIAEAGAHVFGYCLLNDWSARDIQAWEAQPLGPFLAKNFATTVSPFVVTAAALAPFRTAAFARPAGDPAPLPHLLAPQDQAEGGLDIILEAYILTAKMRDEGISPFRLSRGSFAQVYWTVAQMVAHHTSNGCNLEIGDLMASGTVSGPEPESWASLLELSRGGREPIALPGGETRRFLEDGDEVIFRGYCERAGFARIGFGECRAVVEPAMKAG